MELRRLPGTVQSNSEQSATTDTISAHGQCILTRTSATVLALDPKNGEGLFVTVSGTMASQTIPSAGITATTTSCFIDGTGSSSLAADTVYLICVFDNSGTLTLDFLTTTTHAVDTTSGVEIATGDATRTVVGMIRTNASSQLIDTDIEKGILSWFNRRNKMASVDLTNGATSSSTYVNSNTANNLEWLTWADEVVMIGFTADISSNNATATRELGIGIDSTSTVDEGTRVNMIADVGTNGIAIASSSPVSVAEGYHLTSVNERTNAGQLNLAGAGGHYATVRG